MGELPSCVPQHNHPAFHLAGFSCILWPALSFMPHEDRQERMHYSQCGLHRSGFSCIPWPAPSFKPHEDRQERMHYSQCGFASFSCII